MKHVTFLFLTFCTFGFAQTNTLSLDSCLQMAKRNYPLIKQNNLISENAKNTTSNTNKLWLPKLSFKANAGYQSEVVEFMGQSFPHDNYISAVDLEQSIFDGGQIKKQKQLDKLANENELQKNEVELYKLTDRITQLYCTILLNRENLKALIIYKDDIGNKKTIVTASVNNGLVLQSNLDALEAEELKTEQSIIETTEGIRAGYQTLALFITKTIDDSTRFLTTPILRTSKGDELLRPELKVFDTQKDMLNARHKLINSYALPRLSINGEYAYGRPGPNFLNQDFRFFGQAAISLKWNIGTLYTVNNEKQSLHISQQMLDVQREVFEFNVKTYLLTQTATINALTAILEKDTKIIEKRHNIRLTSSEQLKNGSITATDYLVELNAEMQATLNQKVHEIKLMNAITNFNTQKGINNF